MKVHLITRAEVDILGARPKSSIIITKRDKNQQTAPEQEQIQSDEQFARTLQAQFNLEQEQIQSDEQFARILQEQFDCEAVNAIASQQPSTSGNQQPTIKI